MKTDRLEEIRADFAKYRITDLRINDEMGWLISEVDRLRARQHSAWRLWELARRLRHACAKRIDSRKRTR